MEFGGGGRFACCCIDNRGIWGRGGFACCCVDNTMLQLHQCGVVPSVQSIGCVTEVKPVCVLAFSMLELYAVLNILGGISVLMYYVAAVIIR